MVVDVVVVVVVVVLTTILVGIDLTKGIEGLEFTDRCLGTRDSLLDMSFGNVKVGSTIGNGTRIRIVDQNTTDVGQDEVLGGFDSNTLTPNHQDVEILQTRNRFATKGRLLTIDAFGFVIDLIKIDLPTSHPFSPFRFRFCFCRFFHDAILVVTFNVVTIVVVVVGYFTTLAVWLVVIVAVVVISLPLVAVNGLGHQTRVV